MLIGLLSLFGFSTAARAEYSVAFNGVDYYGPSESGYTVFHYTLSWTQTPTSKFSLSHLDFVVGSCLPVDRINWAHTTGMTGVVLGKDPSLQTCGGDPTTVVLKWDESILNLPNTGGSVNFDVAINAVNGVYAEPGGTITWITKAGSSNAGDNTGSSCLETGSTTGMCGTPFNHNFGFVCGAASVNVCGTATTTVNGPTPADEAFAPYTFVWTSSTDPNFSSTDQNITVGSGDYMVVATDSHGFSTTCLVQVKANPNPVPKIDGNLHFCAGSSTTLTASGGDEGATYTWSGDATGTGPTLTVTASGTYTVTIVNSTGCQASASATVVADPPPSANIDALGPLTFCKGGNVTLVASGGTSYLWSTGDTTDTITVSATGDYSVQVSNNNTCPAASKSVHVQVDDPPTADIDASGALTFCKGGSVTLTARGGASFLWSTGATSASITVSETGDYTVQVSNNNTCPAASKSVHVQVDDPPTAKITASGPTTFCQGGSVTLSAIGGTSFLWSTGETTSSITVTTGGHYTVTVSNGNTCPPASDGIDVVVNPLPATPVVSADASICAGTNGHASITNYDPSLTYVWSASNGTVSGGGATVTFTAGTDATQPVVLTVTVTDANGCSSSGSTTVVNKACQPACTLTQGAYGSASGAGTIASVATQIGAGITVGIPTRSFTVHGTDAPCVVLRLPAGGSAAMLPAFAPNGNFFMTGSPNCTTTTSSLVTKTGKFSNVLFGQSLTLKLNMNLQCSGSLSAVTLCPSFMTAKLVNGAIDPSTAATFTIPASVITVLGSHNTVADLANLADLALGGFLPSGVSYSDVNAAVDAINRAFDGGRVKISCVPDSSNQ